MESFGKAIRILAGVGITIGTLLSSVAQAKTIAYWPLGRQGVADVSGNGHNLVAEGVSFSGAGAVLSGGQTAFNTAEALNLTPCTELTVELWVKCRASDNPGPAFLLELSENYNNHFGAFEIGYSTSVTDAVDGYVRSTSNWCGLAGDVGLVSDGAWHHVALVIRPQLDGTQSMMLYIDATHVYKLADYPDGLDATSFFSSTLYIGSRGNKEYKFKGELSDVRISDVALTPDKFVARSGGSTVVAYWPFGSYGNSDASGNGNDLVSSGLTFADGSAYFPGQNMMCMTRRPLDLRACGAATVEFFTRIPPSSTSVQMLLEHSFNYVEAGTGCFCLDINESAEGGLQTAVKTSQGYNIDNVASLTDGAWHHVALVFDPIGSPDSILLYVDRQLRTSVLDEGGTWSLRNAYLYLGSRANISNGFTGELDDIRISNVALAPEEFLAARTTENDAILAYWPMRRGLECNDESGNGHDATNALDLTAAGPVTIECFALNGGTWHHLARVYGNGASDAPTAVFLDGEAYDGSAFDDVCVVESGALVPQAAFAATVDDVKVTAAALTPDRFLKRRTDETPRVLSHWKFSPENPLADETGLFALKTLDYSQVTLRDGAVYFPGCLGLSTKLPLELFPLRAYTVECMVCYPSDERPANVLELSPNYNWSSSAFCLSTQVEPNRPGFGFKVQRNYQLVASNAEQPGGDGWHHWAFTVERAPDNKVTSAFYIDGARQTNQLLSTDDPIEYFSGACKLFFGSRGESGDADLLTYDSRCVYRGMIDDVRISDAALTPEEMMRVDDRSKVEQPVVAHWIFDQDAPLEDKSGNGHTLQGTAMVNNGFASFDGAQFLKTTGGVDLTPYRQVTIEAVFRSRSQSPDQVVLEQGPDYCTADNAGAPIITVTKVNGKGCFTGGTFRSCRMTSLCSTENRRWHHVAVIIDLDEGSRLHQAKLYADGELDDTDLMYQTIDDGRVYLRDFDFFIGMRNGQAYPFTGDIREIRVTARKLLPEEFLTLPEATLWENNGVIAHWRFDGVDPLADASGNGFDLAEPQSGVSFSSSNVATFDGTGRGLSALSNLPLGALDKVTVEFWARANTRQKNRSLLYSGIMSGLPRAFGVSTVRQADSLGVVSSLITSSFQIRYGICQLTNDRMTPETLDLTASWHHYALVFNRSAPSADQMLLYVDGILQPSVPGKTTGYGLPLANSTLCIGSDPEGVAPFNGQIDDVKVTADALTPDRFMNHRSSGDTVIIIR